MPKSKAKSQKKTKMSEEELSDLLQKSLKRKSADTKESDEEEKKPETNLDLQTLEFHNFFQSDNDSKTPVLERIAGSQIPRPIFVGGISRSSATATSSSETSDDFKYVPGTENSNEPKYSGYQEAITNPSERINPVEVGRKQELVPNVNREAFFGRMKDSRISQPSNPERVERAERFDFEQAGRRDPLESRDKKYEKYSLKVPK